MTSKQILTIGLGLGASLMPLMMRGQAQSTTKQQTVDQTPVHSQSATHKDKQFHSEGERIFAQNCSRCHNAPEGFSPSIAGTVVRHMRVRAQLSQHDEQELLRFFNP
jgi:mono/diheme cytochrome c family protein